MMSWPLRHGDPPMFNTTLTNEYIAVANTFQFDVETIEQLVLNAVRASLLPTNTKQDMETNILTEFARLRIEHLAA